MLVVMKRSFAGLSLTMLEFGCVLHIAYGQRMMGARPQTDVQSINQPTNQSHYKFRGGVWFGYQLLRAAKQPSKTVVTLRHCFGLLNFEAALTKSPATRPKANVPYQ